MSGIHFACVLASAAALRPLFSANGRNGYITSLCCLLPVFAALEPHAHPASGFTVLFIASIVVAVSKTEGPDAVPVRGSHQVGDTLNFQHLLAPCILVSIFLRGPLMCRANLSITTGATWLQGVLVSTFFGADFWDDARRHLLPPLLRGKVR